ncbi:MAG TPA: hypothetical protein VGZ47_23080, partial [Gemmataceae bacterium]|nr:hypothetical protein [Gemmataceae bacterium]
QPWEATGAAPPIVYRWVWPLAIGGLAAVVIGAIVGSTADAANPNDPLAGTRGVLAALRLIFTIGGMIAVGLAVSLRPTKALLLALAAVTCFIARYGDAFHAEWDSARMFAGFGAIVATVATFLMAAPLGIASLLQRPDLVRPVRYALVSALVLLHFGGIGTAVTSPGAQPWVTGMLSQKVYRPYLQCVYLTNAYHFYSPEPGPAYMLWFCVYYDNDDKNTDTAEAIWITLPKRPGDMIDPLSLTYYRRLSITATAYAPTQVQTLPDDVYRARILATQGKNGIPLHPEFMPLTLQYLVPQDQVRYHMLPSFVRHVAKSPEAQHNDPNVKIKWIKVYMVEHRIITPPALENGIDFYDAPTYKPYFFGEFDAEGNLRNPNDPMLYWMVPILFMPKNPPVPDYYTPKNHPNDFKLIDGVELHSGFKAPINHYPQSKKAEGK